MGFFCAVVGHVPQNGFYGLKMWQRLGKLAGIVVEFAHQIMIGECVLVIRVDLLRQSHSLVDAVILSIAPCQLDEIIRICRVLRVGSFPLMDKLLVPGLQQLH